MQSLQVAEKITYDHLSMTDLAALDRALGLIKQVHTKLRLDNFYISGNKIRTDNEEMAMIQDIEDITDLRTTITMRDGSAVIDIMSRSGTVKTATFINIDMSLLPDYDIEI